MSGVLKAFLRARNTIIACVVLLSTPQSTWSADGSSDELQRCRSIEDASLRLACYDEINGQQVPEQLSQPAPVDPPPAKSIDDSEPPPAKSIDDSETATLGLPDDDKLAVRAVLTKCTKNANNRYFFYFANGQVWKQSSSKRLKLKDCEFDVTITKDFFGYKMQRDGEKKQIRIARVK